ncbi:30S ribosomal protein S6 [Abditibacteriota bacterium]|nr:30S ribosomal protein S6 [Abditibacteriota bacterium]
MAENTTATAPVEETTATENSAPERNEGSSQYQRSDRDRSDRSGGERSAGPRVMATDLLPELGEGEAPTSDKEVSNGRAYEITYIVQANVANAVEETQERVKTLIENAEGALDNVRVSEARRLAYPIDKKTDGVYVVINARFKKDLTTELDRFFKLEERVLRHVILREDA